MAFCCSISLFLASGIDVNPLITAKLRNSYRINEGLLHKMHFVAQILDFFDSFHVTIFSNSLLYLIVKLQKFIIFCNFASVQIGVGCRDSL